MKKLYMTKKRMSDKLNQKRLAKLKPLKRDLSGFSDDQVSTHLRTEKIDSSPLLSGNRHHFVAVVKAESWWAEKSRENPVIFYEYMTGYTPAKHHRLWLANMFHPDRKRINIIAPRESGKSTVIVYGLGWWIGVNPLLTNGIVSVSESQATDRLRMLRFMIESNPRYRNVFPDVHIDARDGVPNTQTEFNVWSNRNGISYSAWRMAVESFGSAKDSTVYASGLTGRRVIGSRISGLLILDDIIDENMLSFEAQNNVMRRLSQTLIPTVKEEGRVINIGTRWMPDDVPDRLSKNPAWHTIMIPAITYDEEGRPRSYWPEYWPIEKLERKRVEMENDALFSTMYLNDPSSNENLLFNASHLSLNLPSVLPPFKHLVITTDLATTVSQRSDYTVFALVAADKSGNHYLLDMFRGKITPEEQVRMLVDFHASSELTYGRVDYVLVEAVAGQRYFSAMMSQQAPHITVHSVTPKGDKYSRATPLAQLCSIGKFYFNHSLDVFPAMRAEWMNFPVGRHDDTIDALSLYVNYAPDRSASVVRVDFIKSPNFI